MQPSEITASQRQMNSTIRFSISHICVRCFEFSDNFQDKLMLFVRTKVRDVPYPRWNARHPKSQTQRTWQPTIVRAPA